MAFDHVASMPPGPDILENDAQQIERVALDDIELAVHVGFGSGQHRIERDRPLGARRLDADVDRVAGAVAELVGCTVRPGDAEIAGADETARRRAATECSWQNPTPTGTRLVTVPNLLRFEKFLLAQKRRQISGQLPAAAAKSILAGKRKPGTSPGFP